MSMYENKRILVTGGTGSIGSEIVRQLLVRKPKQVRVFSRDETKQFYLKQELNDIPASKLRFLIGDVRDRERLHMAMDKIDIVFHAAALKHVPSSEENPFETIRTNVWGTQNVIETAIQNGIERVTIISTDKAANPISVMGASKLLAEKITTAARLYAGGRNITFGCVRFGNVIGSRGSVIDLFKKQIQTGGPVTITDPEMMRFMMSIPQAVDLVLEAATIIQGGEIITLKMPVIKLQDLTDIVIEEYAPKVGKDPKSIAIKNIGIRPGEKIFEELMTTEEGSNVYETEKYFIIVPHNLSEIKFNPPKLPGARECKEVVYTTEGREPISKEQIRKTLRDAKVFDLP